ncbi:MAG: hypothetical protein WKG06_11860 [Segetibacter sp.]
MKELGQLMRNRKLMLSLRENVWSQRSMFMFDNHVNALVKFFREVIEKHRNKETEQRDIEEVLFPAIHQKAVG